VANTILPRVSQPELIRYRPPEGLDGTAHGRLVHATPRRSSFNKLTRAKVERKGWVGAGIPLPPPPLDRHEPNLLLSVTGPAPAGTV
jgi:hypothetical protein